MRFPSEAAMVRWTYAVLAAVAAVLAVAVGREQIYLGVAIAAVACGLAYLAHEED